MVVDLCKGFKIIVEIIIENDQMIGLFKFLIDLVDIPDPLACGGYDLQIRIFVSDIFLENGGKDNDRIKIVLRKSVETEIAVGILALILVDSHICIGESYRYTVCIKIFYNIYDIVGGTLVVV